MILSLPRSLRGAIFWLHLTAASIAGLAILILCLSGAAMAFRDQALNWAERDVRHPGLPAGTTERLTFHEVLATASHSPAAGPISLVSIPKDPGEAIVLQTADRKTWFVNPYSGEVRQAAAPRLEAFFLWMNRLHVRPPYGDGISAAANVVFVFLTLSGLYLWWPQTWSWSAVRPTIWFVSGARGRARDWNWHNVVAIWLLPILLVLGATGLVLSYASVNRLMFRLAGQPLPDPVAANQPVKPADKPVSPAPKLAVPPHDSPSLDDFMDQVEKRFPDWTRIVISIQPAMDPAKSGVKGFLSPQQLSAYVTRPHPWPVFAGTFVTRDVPTGELRLKDSYATLGPGMRARRWVRLLHSGDAFGVPGQMVAGLACLGGCLLVYTGYAMALRRLFKRIRPRAS